MFFIDDEERDLEEDLDEEDADLDDENSDDEEDDDVEDDDDSDDEEDDEDEDDEEDDSKKKSKKSKSDRDDSKSRKNRDNARRRKSSKDRDTRGQDDLRKDVEALKKSDAKRALLERKRTFGYEHGLSPKQVDFVFRTTKRPTAKYLSQPEIAAGLQAIKQGENVSQNTPSNNGRVFKNDKGKPKSWTELKPDERQSRFTERRRAILESKR